MDSLVKDYVDKSMETVRAQNDARFAEVLARLDVMDARLSSMKPFNIWQVVATVAGGVVAILGIGIAVLTFSSDRFDSGISSLGIVKEYVDGQRQRDAAQDARLDRIIGTLESIDARIPPGSR